MYGPHLKDVSTVVGSIIWHMELQPGIKAPSSWQHPGRQLCSFALTYDIAQALPSEASTKQADLHNRYKSPSLPGWQDLASGLTAGGSWPQPQAL